MKMIRTPSSYTKRGISKYVLHFPYLPSKGLCIRWSLHAILIFYHTLGSLVFLSYSSAPWESSSMSSFFVVTEKHLHSFSGQWMMLGWGPGRTYLHSFRMKVIWAAERQHYVVWGCKKLLWHEILGGHICAISGCKVDYVAKGQH